MDEQTRVAELKKQIDAMSRGSVSALAVLEGGGPVIPRGSGGLLRGHPESTGWLHAGNFSADRLGRLAKEELHGRHLGASAAAPRKLGLVPPRSLQVTSLDDSNR